MIRCGPEEPQGAQQRRLAGPVRAEDGHPARAHPGSPPPETSSSARGQQFQAASAPAGRGSRSFFRCWARVSTRFTAKAMPSSMSPNAMARANWPPPGREHGRGGEHPGLAREVPADHLRGADLAHDRAEAGQRRREQRQPASPSSASSAGPGSRRWPASAAEVRVDLLHRRCDQRCDDRRGDDGLRDDHRGRRESSQNAPSGPLRHRSTVTNSPMTTGGRPIPVLAPASSTRLAGEPGQRDGRPRPPGTPRTKAIRGGGQRHAQGQRGDRPGAPVTVSSRRRASHQPGQQHVHRHAPPSCSGPRLARPCPHPGRTAAARTPPVRRRRSAAAPPRNDPVGARLAPSDRTRSPAFVVISITW